MRDINGTLYCNDGDWVESRSALVEHMDGRLELIHWAGAPVSLDAASRIEIQKQGSEIPA
jgi:hypothetical protein